MPNEKTIDAEAAKEPLNPDNDTLQPFKILLAARRGLQTDQSINKDLIIPNGRVTFSGNTGTKSKLSCASSRIQGLIFFAYMSRTLRCLVLFYAFHWSYMFSIPESENMETKRRRRLTFRILPVPENWFRNGLCGMVGVAITMYLVRVYLRWYFTSSLSLDMDPNSYQFRVMRAFEEKGWVYRGVVSDSLEDMEKVWERSLGTVEKFTVEGVVDHGDLRERERLIQDDGVYDIQVEVKRDGKFKLSFRSAEAQAGSHMAVNLS